MAKFYIINEPETDKLWLVDLETKTVECLDTDILGLSGKAGAEFAETINGLRENLLVAEGGRSDPSERMSSASPATAHMVMAAAGRSDPSERMSSASPALH
ncbi:MAG: hypothetical protein ACREIP_08925 [Alphaproteobacteria bacterium]